MTASCERCQWLVSVGLKSYAPSDVREYTVVKGSQYTVRQYLCDAHVKALRSFGVKVLVGLSN